MARKNAAEAAAETTPKATKAPAEKHGCACGCGESVERVFRQGHDQRLISKLAQDLVYGSEWGGRCMGILAADEVKADIQARMDKVAAYVSAKLSPGLAAKFANAAHRQWDLSMARTARTEAKAERQAEAAAKLKARAAKKASKAEFAPSEVAGSATPKLVTATATNEDVDAAEQAEGKYVPGQEIKVRIGKRSRKAIVRGMNQAGEVTAVAVTNGTTETLKTEGQFVVVG